MMRTAQLAATTVSRRKRANGRARTSYHEGDKNTEAIKGGWERRGRGGRGVMREYPPNNDRGEMEETGKSWIAGIESVDERRV